jgi:hypothetical protein
MRRRSSYSQAKRPQPTETAAWKTCPATLLALAGLLFTVGFAPQAKAGKESAPDWMHALVNVPLPAHDEKTEAVLLYSEDFLTVQPDGKIDSLLRRAYKILRPEGRKYGLVEAYYDAETRITGIHGWCIPAQGKDYEVGEKDAIDASPLGQAGGDMEVDTHLKLLRIPAPDPGNIVGYEIEQERRPYVLQGRWSFQESVPVRETRYYLRIPPDWQYKTAWVNHPEVAPTQQGSTQWQLSDIPAIKWEERMPPWHAVAGEMIVSLFPPGGQSQIRGFSNWSEMGTWYAVLTSGRRDASPAIREEVAKITASTPNVLEKMQALARFLQRDIRYVAIELGIGGYQPHPAPEVFVHRYGDCKDKATLLSSMLREIGVESYYIVAPSQLVRRRSSALSTT